MPVYAELKDFLDKTATIQTDVRKNAMFNQGRGELRSGTYDINGRLISGNSRRAIRLIVKDNRLFVRMGPNSPSPAQSAPADRKQHH
jgi:hypothetical protein